MAPSSVPTVVSQNRPGIVDFVPSGGYLYLHLATNQIDAVSHTSASIGSESIAERAVSDSARLTPDDPGVIVTHGGDDESLVVSGSSLAATTLHAGDDDPGLPTEIVRIPAALRLADEESRFVLSGGRVYDLGVHNSSGPALDSSMVTATYNEGVDRLATYAGGLLWTYNGNTLVVCPLAFEMGRWGCQSPGQWPIPTSAATFRRILHHPGTNSIFLLANEGALGQVWRVDLGSNEDAVEVTALEGARDIAVVGDHLAVSMGTNVRACCLGPGGVGSCASTFFASEARTLYPIASDRFVMANATHLAILRVDP